MRAMLLCGLSAAILLTLPATPAGATTAPPAAPTNVTVAWGTETPFPGAPPIPAVRVTWDETGARPNLVCHGGVASASCVETTAADPNSVLLHSSQFGDSASTDVGVQVSGSNPSAFAFSESFDTWRPGLPTITAIQPWIDGRLFLAWDPAPVPVDSTPNDPLDLPLQPPGSFSLVANGGDVEEPIGANVNATSTAPQRPTGGLIRVLAVNEWFPAGVRSATALDAYLNIWASVVSAAIPTTSTYSLPTQLSGLVRSDAWGCTGMPPGCGPGGPGSSFSVITPSPGRRVAIEGRNSATSPWYTVGSALTGADGTFRFTVPGAPGTRDYRAVVLGVFYPASTDAKSAALGPAVHNTTRNRVLSARFDDPTIGLGQPVTARLSMAVRSQVRTTLQRWTGTTWTNVKWVYLTAGAGSYTFTATHPGTSTWRFLSPATTTPQGLPIGAAISPAFSYHAS